VSVLIVGAGVMGSALAWRLAREGVRVQVLERAIPGAEASSAAAGILAPRAEAAENAELRELGLVSLARYPDWAAELERETGIDIGFRRCGLLHVALDAAGVRVHDAMERLAAERLAAAEAHDRWPWLGEVRDALWLPGEGQVDNRRLVAAVYAAAARAGATFLTGRTVTGLARAGRVIGVDTDQGRVEAREVVVCAGAWTSRVPGLERLGIRPTRGQMLALQAKSPPFSPVVFAGGRGYLVPRADGRVLVGATMEDVGFEKAVTAEGLALLARIVVDVAPGLAGLPVVETWAGFRPTPPGDRPLIGALEPGLWVASGHHRNGILLAPITAEILADRLMGRTPAVDDRPFEPRV
jgi:glycine oxidase